MQCVLDYAFLETFSRPVSELENPLVALEGIEKTALTVAFDAGSEVWCDDTSYPRLLTEMINGKAEQRCACFKTLGWSDLRKVYDGCNADSHRCGIITPAA
jgi:hypothetical protein